MIHAASDANSPSDSEDSKEKVLQIALFPRFGYSRGMARAARTMAMSVRWDLLPTA